MYCPRCGTLHGDHARFCVHCGSEMPNLEGPERPAEGQTGEPQTNSGQAWTDAAQTQTFASGTSGPDVPPYAQASMPHLADYTAFAIVLLCLSGIMLCFLEFRTFLFFGGAIATSIIALVSAVRAKKLFSWPGVTETMRAEAYRLSARARILCWMTVALLSVGIVIVVWVVISAMNEVLYQIPDLFRQFEKNIYWQ